MLLSHRESDVEKILWLFSLSIIRPRRSLPYSYKIWSRIKQKTWINFSRIGSDSMPGIDLLNLWCMLKIFSVITAINDKWHEWRLISKYRPYQTFNEFNMLRAFCLTKDKYPLPQLSHIWISKGIATYLYYYDYQY